MTKTKQTVYNATRVWPEHAWNTDLPFTAEAIAAGEIRGEMTFDGSMWRRLRGYTALAVEFIEDTEKHFDKYNSRAVIHGHRKLLGAKESGYDLEGRVSISGKTYRAFTSTMMFLVNGKLVDVAILYICK